MPGEHHFYISFNTEFPGVRISPRLREKYPEEMTIVLQHQFWDLAVTEHGFEVGLSFSNVPEKLYVPFEAVTGFFDPSVKFGLQVRGSEPRRPKTREPTRPTGPREVPRGAASEPQELAAHATQVRQGRCAGDNRARAGAENRRQRRDRQPRQIPEEISGPRPASPREGRDA